VARYLLVAHQTAESPELIAAALGLAGPDPKAEFTILVPATPVQHLLVWEERETKAAARHRAALAASRLRHAGCRISETRIGDQNPVLAVEDELRRLRYAAIVVSTFPPRWSRWLKLDVISRLNRSFPNHRLIHVISEPEPTSSTHRPVSKGRQGAAQQHPRAVDAPRRPRA
jgi:hypothetical protein